MVVDVNLGTGSIMDLQLMDSINLTIDSMLIVNKLVMVWSIVNYHHVVNVQHE